MFSGEVPVFIKEIEKNLRLSLLTPNKAEELYNLVDKNREYLKKWMIWPPETKSPDDTKSFIKGALVGLSEMNEMACGIEYEGSLVGVITFNKIDSNLKKVVIGYWISEEYQGKGIITKSCFALINYAFSTLHMEKIEINVATKNVPSQKICEGLGFILEGVITNSENLHGNIVDHNIYGLAKIEHNKTLKSDS